jgi:dihydrofolate reductase
MGGDEGHSATVDPDRRQDPARTHGDDLRNDDRDFTTLGSGSIVQQLTQLGLVDEYTFVVNPVLLGAGKNAFIGIDTAQLDLSEARSFENGLVWLTYRRT